MSSSLFDKACLKANEVYNSVVNTFQAQDSEAGTDSAVSKLFSLRRLKDTPDSVLYFSSTETTDIRRPRILTSEEFDVNNPNFAPQKSEAHSRLSWIHRLSNNEFIALIGAAIVGPFIIAVGISKGVQRYNRVKFIKRNAAVSKQFLRQIAAYDPKYMNRFMPVIPPNAKQANSLKDPIDAKYPYVMDPTRLGPDMTWNNWRNPNMQDIQKALARVEKMQQSELSLFHHMYIHFPHVVDTRLAIEKTIHWVMTGKVTIDDCRLQLVPKCAADDLSLEDKKILAKENWQTISVTDKEGLDAIKRIMQKQKQERQQREQEALDNITHEKEAEVVENKTTTEESTTEKTTKQ